MNNLILFSLNASLPYAKEVATCLNISLSKIEERYFDDGEPYVRSLVNVRGHDVFVIQSLYSDKNESVNSKFVKLLMFIGSLKDASAKSITAVIPYLAFARQDRKVQSREPIATKYTAQLIEAVGCSRILVMDIHNLSALQNSFRVPVDNLETKHLHADWCADRLKDKKKVAVLAPDAGGYARADRFTHALQKRLIERGWSGTISTPVFAKLRVNGQVNGGNILGDVEGAEVVICDDMISTGATLVKAGKMVQKFGGHLNCVCVTHGLFVGKANELLDGLDTTIVVTDTVEPWRLTEANRQKVQLVKTTQLVADAIWRIYSGTGSISDLLSK